MPKKQPLWEKLFKPLISYTRWLHTQWPSGTVEPYPLINPDGTTSLPGVRIAGDLLGVPLLKFAVDSGAERVREFLREPDYHPVYGEATVEDNAVDLAIIGGGVSGLSAAIEARKQGLKFRMFEAYEPFSTIVQFPKGKPIFTYPTSMKPRSEVKLAGKTREQLLQELRQQAGEYKIKIEIRRVFRVRRVSSFGVVDFDDGSPPLVAKRILLAIGKSGNYRKLGVPGDEKDIVTHRLFDPEEYRGKQAVVVGGGDSALETAIALHGAGVDTQLIYRQKEFARAKTELVEAVEPLRKEGRILLSTEVLEVQDDRIKVRDGEGQEMDLSAEIIFAMTGREAPYSFLKRVGIQIQGLYDWKWWLSFIAAFGIILFIYRWKSEGSEVAEFFRARSWFPYGFTPEKWTSQNFLARTLAANVKSPGFYYELLYTVIILAFGVRRMVKFPTPYIKRQTLSLMLVQLIPLFLLPYFLLPLAQEFGAFDSGAGKWLADQLFPVIPDTTVREYWRSVGFILAWPLFVSNIFTPDPLGLWLAISLVQTFVIIPWMVRKWGKGVYCGWICSCGAMAETLGDPHRGKMPHGPKWNRLNMAGQLILAIALGMLALRLISWGLRGSELANTLENWFIIAFVEFKLGPVPFSYSQVVDYFLAGILGMGLYFHFSGRIWCRFFCPLAALMNIYARFSKFRIFADKSKCISCNACTTNCHQGIDVMGFAQRGNAMEDPECVRCSACVTVCPTGTLTFGSVGKNGEPVYDRWKASPVQIREAQTQAEAQGSSPQ